MTVIINLMSDTSRPGENMSIKEDDFHKSFQLDKSFKQIKKLNDPRFGEIKLFQNNETKAVVAMKELRFAEKKHAEKEIIKCKTRLKIENQYVLPLINYSIEKQSSLCSSFYNLILYYEYPPTDLKKEMINRKKVDQHFTTEELLHIIYQQIEAHKHLELTRSFHGDVRPMYFGLNATLWHTKLIHKPEEIDSKQKILQTQMHHLQTGDSVYQSPLMYESLMSKNFKFEFNPNKEDMFATAMVIIELGIQESLQDVYKNGKFDHDAMRKHVMTFEGIYCGRENQLLVTSVLTMLEPDEARRPHFILLHERMPSYYSIVKYFENLREDPSLNEENLLETFIYIDQLIIEGFTLEPGVRQVKVKEGPKTYPEDAQINPMYSDRNIGTEINKLNDTNDKKIIERIVRRFEARDGTMVEKVEHFHVKEGDKFIKTEEYEIINNHKCNIKYFDSNGKEVDNKHENNNETDKQNQNDNIVNKNSKEDISIKKDISENKYTKSLESEDNRMGKDSNRHINKSIEKHKNNKFNAFKPDIDDQDNDNKVVP